MREWLTLYRRRTLLVLVLFAFATCTAGAIELSVEVGFYGLFSPNTWAPVVVTVDNPGPSARGTLYLVAKKGGFFSANPWEQTIARDVVVPAAATGRYRFTMSMSEVLTRYRVELELDDGRVARLEDEAVGLSTGRRLVVAMTGSQSFDHLLADPSISLAYLRPETAPIEWHAYDGVLMVVVGDADLRLFDEAALVAVREWVSAGGVVFLAAPDAVEQGAGAGALRGGVPLRSVDRVGEELFLVNMAPSGRGEPPTGFTAVEPGVFSRYFGRGSILYGNLRAVSNPALLVPANADPVPEATSSLGLRTTPLLTRVAQSIDATSPILPVLLLVALFVIVVTVLILRRFRVVAPIAAVLAGGTIIGIMAQDTLPDLVHLETVRAYSTARLAAVDSRVLVFSRRPSRTSVAYKDAYFVPPAGEDSFVWSPAPAFGRVEIRSQRRWNDSLVSLRSVKRFVLSVRFEGRDGSIVRIRNDEARTIRDLRLHRAGSEVVLGDLPPDESLTAAGPATGLESDEESGVVRHETIEQILRRNVLADLHQSLVLTGFLDEPLVDLELDPGYSRAHTAVLLYSVLEEELVE